jgi:TPR repeat protein
VAQDFVLAAEWYEKAAAHGCAVSSNHLGEMYYHGEGVEQDFERAVAEYRRAAEEEGEEGGHAGAQSSLGFCYEQGQGVEKDYVQARAWYKKAALQGDTEAIRRGGLMCLNGQGGAPDYKYAARMFRESAEDGDGKAQNWLGSALIYPGVAQDLTQAVAWFTKSADNGISDGQANLARCYLNGMGVERDVFEADRLFWLAALQGHAKAQGLLGEIFRKGELYCGVKMYLARKYLKLAAEQGDAPSIARLEEMRRDGFRCMLCGADAAPYACSYCPNARYCDMECSIAHWRHGGGFASTLGAAEEKHKETCNKTLARRAARAGQG